MLFRVSCSLILLCVRTSDFPFSFDCTMKTSVYCIYFVLIWVLTLRCMESRHIQDASRERRVTGQDHLSATPEVTQSTEDLATEHGGQRNSKGSGASYSKDCSSQCKNRPVQAQTAREFICDRPYHVGMAVRIANKTAKGYTAKVHEVFTPSSLELAPHRRISIVLPEIQVSECPCPQLHIGSLYLVAGYTDATKEALHLDSRTLQLQVQHRHSRMYFAYKKYITNIFRYDCPTQKASEPETLEPKGNGEESSYHNQDTGTPMPKNQNGGEK